MIINVNGSSQEVQPVQSLPESAKEGSIVALEDGGVYQAKTVTDLSGQTATTWVSVSYVLPKATKADLGGIKVGNNLTIDEDGTLNAEKADYTLPVGDYNQLGGIQFGTIRYDAVYPEISDNKVCFKSLYISVNKADGSVDETNLQIRITKDLRLPHIALAVKEEDAYTGGSYGMIKRAQLVSGTNDAYLYGEIQLSDGTFYEGCWRYGNFGSSLSVVSWKVKTPDIASSTSLGSVMVGDGLSITEDGVLSANGGGGSSDSTKLTPIDGHSSGDLPSSGVTAGAVMAINNVVDNFVGYGESWDDPVYLELSDILCENVEKMRIRFLFRGGGSGSSYKLGNAEAGFGFKIGDSSNVDYVRSNAEMWTADDILIRGNIYDFTCDNFSIIDNIEGGIVKSNTSRTNVSATGKIFKIDYWENYISVVQLWNASGELIFNGKGTQSGSTYGLYDSISDTFFGIQDGSTCIQKSADGAVYQAVSNSVSSSPIIWNKVGKYTPSVANYGVQGEVKFGYPDDNCQYQLYPSVDSNGKLSLTSYYICIDGSTGAVTNQFMDVRSNGTLPIIEIRVNNSSAIGRITKMKVCSTDDSEQYLYGTVILDNGDTYEGIWQRYWNQGSCTNISWRKKVGSFEALTAAEYTALGEAVDTNTFYIITDTPALYMGTTKIL